AQCSFVLGLFGKVSTPGLRNVTVSPTETRRWVGCIAEVVVASAAVAVSAVRLVRASSTVLSTVAPSTADPLTGRRIDSGAVTGPSWLPDSVTYSPPILNAHRESPAVMDPPYG